MCSILTDLNDKNITLSVRYYGPGDLATGWEIKTIVDNAPLFNSFYISYPLNGIENTNDYIIYLFSLKFCALAEIVPHLQQEEHQAIITVLSEKANNACSTVKTGEVIKFINSHIEKIFTLENHLHDIQDVTLELIKKYSSGIQPHVYNYLCTEHYHLIIDNFNSFFKIIKADPSLFEKIYPTGHLSDLQERRFKETLDIFSSIFQSDNQNLKELVNDRITVLCTDIESLIPTITGENVMMNEGVVREFTSFLQHIKHPKANDFVIHYKAVEEILFKHIHETGTHCEYEIPVGEIIEQFTKTEHWMLRLLSLTHSYVPNSNPSAFKSRLSFDRDETHHLMDFCSSNIPTDSYFTRSHQMTLGIHAGIGAGTMVGIMSQPEVYEDYAKLIMSAILIISEQMQREDEHLFDDWVLLDRMLQTIIANRELGVESIQTLCYSAAVFTCSLMEKILRLFYVDRVKGSVYVPVEHATLGQLLTENNAEIVKAFDPIHTKHLAFFMLKCGDKKIGHNYRNRLAHWTEIKSTSLNISLVAELLWLFTDVLNTIFAFYLEQTKLNEEQINGE